MEGDFPWASCSSALSDIDVERLKGLVGRAVVIRDIGPRRVVGEDEAFNKN